MERQSQALQAWEWIGATRALPGGPTKYTLGGVRFWRLLPSFGAAGSQEGSALMAVMRKMLAVAAHLLKHEEESYDPSKVCGGDATSSAPMR